MTIRFRLVFDEALKRRTILVAMKTGDGGFERALRPIALALPGAEEGVACAGTALESATFHVKKKTFLFVGPATLRLKLDASRREAEALAKKEPARFQVGAMGWVTLRYGAGDAPPVALLERWIAESHGVIVGSRAKGAVASKKATKNAVPAKKRARG